MRTDRGMEGTVGTGNTGTRMLAMVWLLLVAGFARSLTANPVVWQGTVNNDWFEEGNWNPAAVPGPGADVIVDGTILLTNETAELASFTMTGGTMTFSNWTTRLRAVEVDLQGGTLTHTAQSATSTNEFGEWIPDARVWIDCSNLTVQAAAKIETDLQGYAPGYGPGASRRGAAHGGRGGVGRSEWSLRSDPYGSLQEPTEPGSGGDVPGSTISRSGGGAIRIDADGEVAIHGSLTANGGDRITTHGSGSSGGSILIHCRTFAGSGTGLLSATGGIGTHDGSPGGGGRIAVIYDETDQAGLATVNPGVRFDGSQGTGGKHPETAEPGTLYFPDMAFISDVMTDQWQGGDIHIPGFTDWTLNQLAIAGRFGLPNVTNLSVAQDMSLSAGGALTVYSTPTNQFSVPDGFLLTVGGELEIAGTLFLHSDPTNGASPRVECHTLTVAQTGRIDADIRGYGYLGFGAFSGTGVGGSNGGGAGHGGYGSSGYSSDARRGIPYGDPLMPVEPGSGGGHTSLSGFGGGAIRLYVTESATIHGTLTANGQRELSTHGGGGSGGSILIQCKTFHGSSSGLLRAEGGTASNNGGAGAGGRIAVLYDPAEQAALPEPNPDVGFSAAPGSGGVHNFLAERGTLYLPDADTLFLSSHMTAQWQDIDLVIPGMTHWALPALQLDGQFSIPTLETMAVAGDVTITSGGRLALHSHPSNTVAKEIGFRLDIGGALEVQSGGGILMVSDVETGAVPYIECGSMVLHTGGLIDANFRGFNDGKGAGRGTYRAGGGYGGAGSRGADAVENAGQPYARAFAPIYPGSGAGVYSDLGGRGGGAVRISARGTMTVDGTIRADGMNRRGTHAGAGSGGGILLTANSFSGAGQMHVEGGSTGNNGGAGGGGRICVWTPFMSTEYLRQLAKRNLPSAAIVLDHDVLWPELDVSVAPGTGGTNPAEAQEGTVFFGHIPSGTLFMMR